MIDGLRTVLARFLVHHLHRPRPLVVAAWLWLAADTEDHAEKCRGLEAVLELNPEHEAARAASALLFQREVKRIERESIADRG